MLLLGHVTNDASVNIVLSALYILILASKNDDESDHEYVEVKVGYSVEQDCLIHKDKYGDQSKAKYKNTSDYSKLLLCVK